MVVSSKHELFVFFGSLLGGMIIGMIFDLFRIIRPSDKTNCIVLGIHDLLLWGAITVAIFSIIFITNNAAVRWYEFAGMTLGAIIYFMVLSNIFVCFLTAIFRTAKKLIIIALKIIFFPIKIVCFLLRPFFRFFKTRFRFLKRIYRNIRLKLRNQVKRIKHSVKKI